MLTAYAKADRDDLTPADRKPCCGWWPRSRKRRQADDDGTNSGGSGGRGSLGEVLAHVRGEVALPCRIVDDPAAEHILALRKRLKLSRRSSRTDSVSTRGPCRIGNRGAAFQIAPPASC